MLFDVGPWKYRVLIHPTNLFGDDGQEVAGLCVWIDHEIIISGVIPRERRLAVLLHELKHAWVFTFGDPADTEADAQQSAAFTAMFHKSFPEQGGESALMAMEPVTEDSPPPAQPAQGSSTLTWAQASPDGGTECGCCGRRFSAGEIATEPAKFVPLTGKTLVQRGVYCEGCNYVQIWNEGVLLDMSPSGAIVGKLGQLRGTDAVEWLRQHGEQAGVMVA